MQTDKIIARSETTGSSARRRLELKFSGRISQEFLEEVRHEVELAYLKAVQDVFLDLKLDGLDSGNLRAFSLLNHSLS